MCGGQQVEDEDRRPDDEDEDRQDDREHHVDVRQPLDAPGDPGHRRQHEGSGQDGDDGNEQRCGRLMNPADDVQTRPDLQRAQAERRDGAEQGREDGENVDDLAARTVRTMAE